MKCFLVIPELGFCQKNFGQSPVLSNKGTSLHGEYWNYLPDSPLAFYVLDPSPPWDKSLGLSPQTPRDLSIVIERSDVFADEGIVGSLGIVDAASRLFPARRGWRTPSCWSTRSAPSSPGLPTTPCWPTSPGSGMPLCPRIHSSLRSQSPQWLCCLVQTHWSCSIL